jgi:hypothetical protein
MSIDVTVLYTEGIVIQNSCLFRPILIKLTMTSHQSMLPGEMYLTNPTSGRRGAMQQLMPPPLSFPRAIPKLSKKVRWGQWCMKI